MSVSCCLHETQYDQHLSASVDCSWGSKLSASHTQGLSALMIIFNWMITWSNRRRLKVFQCTVQKLLIVFIFFLFLINIWVLGKQVFMLWLFVPWTFLYLLTTSSFFFWRVATYPLWCRQCQLLGIPDEQTTHVYIVTQKYRLSPAKL